MSDITIEKKFLEEKILWKAQTFRGSLAKKEGKFDYDVFYYTENSLKIAEASKNIRII